MGGRAGGGSAGAPCSRGLYAWAGWEKEQEGAGPLYPSKAGGGSPMALGSCAGGSCAGSGLPVNVRLARRLSHFDSLEGPWEERFTAHPEKGSLLYFGWERDLAGFAVCRIRGGVGGLIFELVARQGPSDRGGEGGGGSWRARTPGFSTEPLTLPIGGGCGGGDLDLGEGAGRNGKTGLLLKVATLARAPAASAQGLAVAAAAGVGPGLDAQALGSSPPGTFSHEMLHFLGSTVKRKSKGGRKRSPAKEAGVECLSLQPYPHPRELGAGARRHFLEGYWVGDYGPRHGQEIARLHVQSTEPGGPPMLVAIKVLGDPWVPAGAVTWQVCLEPLLEPWPQEEAMLVHERRNIVLANSEVDEAELVSLGTNRSLPGRGEYLHPCKVASIEESLTETVRFVRMGHVHIAMSPGGTLHWFRGRLWEYDSGRIAFITDPLFGMLPNHITMSVSINFSRLDLERSFEQMDEC